MSVGTYQTICADPPWKYTNKRVERPGGPDRRGAPAESRYDTMTTGEIRDLPVKEWAAESAHLYLWVTNPRLYRGYKDERVSPLDVMEAWGFEYKTMLTWVKTGAPGLGFYFRGATEHVLFGVRGRLQIPAAVRKSNVIQAPRGRHSAKPDVFYDIIEQTSPAPRLEMFSRRERLGWDSWGHESAGTANICLEVSS